MRKEINRESSEADLLQMQTSAKRFQRDLQKTAKSLFSSSPRHMVVRAVNNITAHLFDSEGLLITARGSIDDGKQIVFNLRIAAKGDFDQRKKKGIKNRNIVKVAK